MNSQFRSISEIYLSFLSLQRSEIGSCILHFNFGTIFEAATKGLTIIFEYANNAIDAPKEHKQCT